MVEKDNIFQVSFTELINLKLPNCNAKVEFNTVITSVLATYLKEKINTASFFHLRVVFQKMLIFEKIYPREFTTFTFFTRTV